MAVKVRVKQAFLWSVVVTLLFNTVAFAAVTTKNQEIKLDNVQSQMDQAATAQAITYLMKKCVPVVRGYSHDDGDFAHSGWSDTIFTESGKETIDMSAGPWLEKEIQGKVDDGEVYCKDGGDKILTLFSSLVGAGGPSYVMCNKENRGYPGLITLWKDGKRHNWDCDVYATTGGGEYSYNNGDAGSFSVYGQSYSSGEGYLKILYNHWVDSQNNPYLLRWDDDQSDFTVDGNEGARGYFVVRHDFTAQCGSKVVPKGTYGAVYIQDVTLETDGKIKETETYYEPTGDKADSAVTNITGTRKRTCSQIADSLSGGYKTYFTEYKKALLEAYTDECKKSVQEAWDFKNYQSLFITGKSDYSIKDRVVVTPGGIAKADTQDMQKISHSLPDWESKGLVWRNYTESKGDDGNTEYKMVEITDEDKTSAQNTIELYNSLAPNNFVTTTDDTWTCNAPDGYVVTMEEYQDPTAGVTEGGEVEMTCANSGGAESLGWIVCPILEWMGNAANDVYNDYVAPSLQVEPQLFSQNKDEGTRKAWGAFQSLANIGFIILVLIVIFSQLTGVGIDNYGIKKILPKLIVIAVLVNLSYLICLICVDLSNILGNGFQAMFDNLSTGTPTLSIPDSNASLGEVGTTALTGVAVLAALVVMVGAVWKNPAILLSLLVAALGIVIAIFFLFILLSARQAAIVILTVISPLAFICYMLPNTKKLFDKWLKFWEALLLVYPICGLLIGGGDYVSRLLLSAGFAQGGFISAFTAMIVGVLPIFFIPNVLKGAFAAMGNIGAAITGFGNRVRAGATKGIRNSEGYKSAQKRGLERRTRIKAGYDSKGNPTRIGAAKARIANSRIGKAFGYQSLQSARVAAANKTREEGIQATSELSDMNLKYQKSKNPSLSTEAMLTKQLEEARDRGDANGMFSIIEQAKKSNMQTSHIASMTRSVLGGSKLGSMSDGERKNFLEEFGKKYGNDFLKKDYEQADWARKGGVDAGGSLAGVSGWAGSGASGNIAIDDLKDEDVAALSSENLHNLIDSGKISRSQAQRVWASNGSMDDTSRLMLGTYATTGSSLSKQEAQGALQGAFTGAASGLDADRVAAYTRRTPQSTVIEDVKIRNVENGSNQQSDTLYIHDHGRGHNSPPSP